MDLTPEKTAVASTVLVVAGFLGRWTWERVWRKKDGAADAKKAAEKAQADKVEAVAQQVVAVDRRVDELRSQVGVNSHVIGELQAQQNRLDGKVDGLQKHWTGRFDKLEDEMREGFKTLTEKVEYKLDNLRMELRGDQQRAEELQLKTLEAHQKRVHDRLNEATAAQASALNELMDKLVDRIAEPRPSPANHSGGSQR